MSDAGTRTQTSLKTLLPLMPEIRRCQDVFAQLERKWTWIALTGKINCNAIAATLFDFIFKTRDTFAALRQNPLRHAGRKIFGQGYPGNGPRGPGGH